MFLLQVKCAFFRIPVTKLKDIQMKAAFGFSESCCVLLVIQSNCVCVLQS